MDKAMDLLEQLAVKMGVTVEYLWETLVKQQFIEGVTNITLSVFWLIAFIMIVIFAPKLTKVVNNRYKELAEDRVKNGTGYNGSYRVSSLEEDRYYGWGITIPIIAIVAGCIIFIVIISLVTSGIQQLLNPDYFALKEILQTISGAVQ